MNHTLPMKVAAVVYAVFGIPLLLAPNALIAIYRATELNSTGIYNSMLYGAALVAFAVMTWVASERPILEARPVILGSLVGNGLGFLVALYRQVTDAAVPPTAWLNVVLFLAFGALFAMLYARSAEAQPATRVAS